VERYLKVLGKSLNFSSKSVATLDLVLYLLVLRAGAVSASDGVTAPTVDTNGADVW